VSVFLHRVRMTIWKPQPGPDSSIGAYFGDPVPNSTVIEDLRVQFSVDKDDKTTANTATISVTNLAKATRAELVRLPRRIILEAGYQNQSISTLFIGDVSASPGSQNDGIDNVTTFIAKDGGRAIKNARVNKAFRGSPSVLLQLEECIKAMGLRAPANLTLLQELREQHPHGVSLYGSASDNLTQLLAPYGMGWSIQNGKFVVGKALDTLPGQLVIDAAAGLIGSPELSPPTKPGKPAQLAFRCLLFPELEPGRKVEVRSKTVRGVYKIKGVKHEGDNMDAEMLTSVEAVPVNEQAEDET
jgi:hypothetical protein